MDIQKVLIADDEKHIREILKMYCEKEGFDVIEAADGAEAILKVQSEKPDILILDIMMPVMDGLEVCKQVRKMSDLPIIMLTAKDEDDDRILGLEIGADDYITKPFNSREVVARIKAVAFGQKMTFTAKEMELLWCLATNPGKAFSRNQLLETIWGYSYYGDTRTVDTHIKRIRQKLNIPENSKWDITTIWGVGYKFEVKSRSWRKKVMKWLKPLNILCCVILIEQRCTAI